jgi:hypothetical protein
LPDFELGYTPRDVGRHHYLIPISIGVITLGSFRPAEGRQKTPAPPEFVNSLPVSDAERDLKTPRVDEDAGAEILVARACGG